MNFINKVIFCSTNSFFHWNKSLVLLINFSFKMNFFKWIFFLNLYLLVEGMIVHHIFFYFFFKCFFLPCETFITLFVNFSIKIIFFLNIYLFVGEIIVQHLAKNPFILKRNVCDMTFLFIFSKRNHISKKKKRRKRQS